MENMDLLNKRQWTNNHIHCHTCDGSLGDAVERASTLPKAAKELGATACAITDHGTGAGWLDFYNAALDCGINPVIGLEAYVNKVFPSVLKSEGKVRRTHFLILQKNYKGWKATSRLISETNRHIDAKGKPCATKEMLKQFFGPGTEGHGNVIATSACVGGVIASEFSFNHDIDYQIAKIRKLIDKVEMPEGYENALEKVMEVKKKQEELDEEVERLKPLAAKRYKKRQNSIDKLEESDAKISLQMILAGEMEESRLAKERLAEIKTLKSRLTESIKPEKDIISKAKSKLDKIAEHEENIRKLDASRRSNEEMMANAIQEIRDYVEIFGEGNFYVELQYHGIDLEADVYPKLAQAAKAVGVPVVASNDVHFLKQEDAFIRTMVLNMRNITDAKEWKKPGQGDSEYYLKTGKEMAETLLQILPYETVEEAMDNIDVICNQCHVVIPDDKHYPVFKDAAKLLRNMCEEGIKRRYPLGGTKVFTAEYRTQMEYELSVIDKMGYNDYFCEVADFIMYAKEHGDNSIEIGPGRGSGAGSIVCYLTGITELDPMKYGLMFERFLNPDRVSMPDIDTDFSAHAREICIAYVKQKYGERSVAGIITKGTMAAKKAFDYAGKLYGLEKFSEKKQFSGLVKEMKSLIGNEPNAKLSSYEETLRKQYGQNKNAMEILDRALKLEGLVVSYGQHAAGIIIGDGTDIENYIPLLKTKDDDGKDTFVVQADMVQCEAQLGFIKMDFLGLKNLNIITECMRLITKNHGIKIDPYNLPFESEVFEKIFAAGDTNFVFQFESDGMKRMLKDFKPTCFEDIILLVACYRPGPMQFLTDEGNSVNVIKVKNGITPVSYLVPELEPILKDTYGGIIYQEQVMRICTDLAGFSVAQADNVRRFMSKKKADKLEHEREAFVNGDSLRGIPGCVAKGIPPEKANELFDMMMDFAAYAFNKAHAAAYALVSYITAWLKYHYFEEYICAAMMEQGDKPAQLKEDCDRRGIAITRPDINRSEVGYIPSEDGIIVGLSAIKGLKAAASAIVGERKENGPYRSIEDLIERADVDTGDVSAVILAGACDSFTSNREDALTFAQSYQKTLGDIRKEQTHISEVKAKITETEKEEKSKAKSLKNALEKLQNLNQQLSSIKMEGKLELSTEKRLAYESEYLGMWVTGNPMEDYDVSDKRFHLISDIEEEGKYTVAGVITNLKKIVTKKGDEMCIFSLIDKMGASMKAVAFPNTYQDVKGLLVEGKVIAVTGKTKVEIEEQEEEEKRTVELILSAAEKLLPSVKSLIVSVRDIVEKVEVLLPLIEQFQSENGFSVKISDRLFGEIQNSTRRVSPDITEELTRQGMEFAYA